MSTLTQEQVLQRLNNLPSLPTVVLEVLSSMGQDDVNIDILAEKIAQDQALTAKTLRLANSSFYGMANRITTIQEAIAIVGFRTIRSLATTACLIDTFTGHAHAGFNVMPFWRHAIAAAVCARELASHLDVDPEQAYIAALIHDIGRLILVTQFAPNYEATMAYRAQHDGTLLQAEQAVLGLDHALVGHALTRHWKFPEAMQQAVACHHASVSQNLLPLSRVVIAADAIAHALDLSMDEDEVVPTLPSGLWQQLGLSEQDLLAVFAAAEKQFEAASAVLNF